jgi:hypothetical protein
MADRMERLQILIRPEQRRRLAAVSRARGLPVTALVREAIDDAFPQQTSTAERRAAADSLMAMNVRAPSPEEIDRLLADRFDL